MAVIQRHVCDNAACGKTIDVEQGGERWFHVIGLPTGRMIGSFPPNTLEELDDATAKLDFCTAACLLEQGHAGFPGPKPYVTVEGR